MRAARPVFLCASLASLCAFSGCQPGQVEPTLPKPDPIPGFAAWPKAEPIATPSPKPLLILSLQSTVRDPRYAIMQVASSQIGVREKTGKNDGFKVEAYLATVGLSKGNPYCAAFVYWCGRKALGKANPYPRSAWSPDMVVAGEKVSSKTLARAADTFGIYFPSKGRVAHTGLIEEWGTSSVTTIEANTSGNVASGSAADRDGQGVFRKKRLKAAVYKVRDWIGK